MIKYIKAKLDGHKHDYGRMIRIPHDKYMIYRRVCKVEGCTAFVESTNKGKKC